MEHQRNEREIECRCEKERAKNDMDCEQLHGFCVVLVSCRSFHLCVSVALNTRAAANTLYTLMTHTVNITAFHGSTGKSHTHTRTRNLRAYSCDLCIDTMRMMFCLLYVSLPRWQAFIKDFR